MLCWRITLLEGLLFFLLISSSGQAASIVGSYHDLAHIDEVHVAAWTSVYNDYNRVCVYCHTPHNANSNVELLWNRSLPDNLSYTLYTGLDMDSPAQAPGSYTLMCLSCHDGTIAVDTIANVPSTNVTLGTKHGRMIVPYETVYDCAACHDGWMGEGTNFMGSFLGTDLSNDHPVL